MLDVKGDKGLWFRYRLDYIGTVLEVEESYYDGIIELIEQQQKEIKQLKEFIEGNEYDLTPEFRKCFPNGLT